MKGIGRVTGFEISALALRKLDLERLFILPPPEVSLIDKTVPIEENGELPYSIVRPKSVEGLLPTLFWIPSGALCMDWSTAAVRQASHFAVLANCQVIVTPFRQGPEHKYPIGHNDVYTIISNIMKSPKEHGVDESNVGIGGGSSGGTLAIATILKAIQEGIKVAYAFLSTPVIDFSDEIYNTKEYESVKEFEEKDPVPAWVMLDAMRKNYFTLSANMKDPAISPMYLTVEQLKLLPPTTIIYAENDGFKIHNEIFIKMLKIANVKVTELLIMEEFHAIMYLKVPAVTLPEKMEKIEQKKRDTYSKVGKLLVEAINGKNKTAITI
jgi:acetyl esterase/lipase